MKELFLFAVISFTIGVHAFGQPKSKLQSGVLTKRYVNEAYRFSIMVGDNWTLGNEVKNNTSEHFAMADWGLPKVYSDLEKIETQSSISITAYKKPWINSVENVIVDDSIRLISSEVTFEVVKSNPNARIVYTKTSGVLTFKGKSYFFFKNGIGYIISFTATPGAYDKNIKVFEDFYKSVKFF